jgi:hypothetical protein
MSRWWPNLCATLAQYSHPISRLRNGHLHRIASLAGSQSATMRPFTNFQKSLFPVFIAVSLTRLLKVFGEFVY